LARELHITNPRQLIRLKNSYRLLKGYHHLRRGGALDQELCTMLMHGLFWYEYLYQLKRSERQFAELVVWQWSAMSKWQQQAEQIDHTDALQPPYVCMARRLLKLYPAAEFDQHYPALLRTVEMVVLPNAQMGLLLQRRDVTELLARRGNGDGKNLDPWARVLPAVALNDKPAQAAPVLEGVSNEAMNGDGC
jgi:hypothetical protein